MTISLLGDTITTESALATSAQFIEPDRWIWEPDWKIYFYHWLGIPPYWKWTNEYIKEKLLPLSEKERKHERAYGKIFDQATEFCHCAGFDFDIIEQIKKGKPIRFEIRYRNVESWYDPPLQANNLPGIRAKYYFISLCPICRKSVNIALTHPKRFCPNCERLTENQRLQLKRAIKHGKRICKYCGMVVLPKEYPNREYCCRAHTEKAYRRKMEHEQLIRELEDFKRNGCRVG